MSRRLQRGSEIVSRLLSLAMKPAPAPYVVGGPHIAGAFHPTARFSQPAATPGYRRPYLSTLAWNKGPGGCGSPSNTRHVPPAGFPTRRRARAPAVIGAAVSPSALGESPNATYLKELHIKVRSRRFGRYLFLIKLCAFSPRVVVDFRRGK